MIFVTFFSCPYKFKIKFFSGRAEGTPWDECLCAAMTAADVAVHEEAIVDLLLADLR